MCINLPKKVEKFRPIKKRQPISKKSSKDSIPSGETSYQGLSCSLGHQVFTEQAEVIEMEDIAVLTNPTQLDNHTVAVVHKNDNSPIESQKASN